VHGRNAPAQLARRRYTFVRGGAPVTFSIKKGDLIYTTDGTLGFVSDVFRPEQGNDDEGWAAVDVPGVDGPVYFTARDVQARDETVPSVLLTITYDEATSEDRRREPAPIARGQARREETPPLDVGRPELPEDDAETAAGETLPADPVGTPHPEAVRDWPSDGADERAPGASL
jgi:hypothetical protein